ncbi:MAG: hypothetical protein ABSG35_00775 [Syntrophobacteraceae bacterium]
MLRDLFQRRKATQSELVSATQSEIALVTANFGGIDDVKPLPAHDGIDAFYYTDEKTAAIASPDSVRTWTRLIVPAYPRHDFNPRLCGRYFKHQIHRLDEVGSYRWLVWADASLKFNDLSFLVSRAAALARLSTLQRVLLVPHPDRKTILEEFEYIQSEMAAGNSYLIDRYGKEKMPEQMEYFRARGWNLHAKLWCGTIWMMENTEPLRRAWDAWWDQNLRFGMMDQLSLPVILDDHGIAPQPLALNLWRNSHFAFVNHPKSI